MNIEYISDRSSAHLLGSSSNSEQTFLLTVRLVAVISHEAMNRALGTESSGRGSETRIMIGAPTNPPMVVDQTRLVLFHLAFSDVMTGTTCFLLAAAASRTMMNLEDYAIWSWHLGH